MNEQRAWLIEAGNEPRYWTGRGPHDFRPDVSLAIRFARFEDAERAKWWICKNHALRTAEHLFRVVEIQKPWPTIAAILNGPHDDVGPDVPGGGAS